jgi:hypothetical protein
MCATMLGKRLSPRSEVYNTGSRTVGRCFHLSLFVKIPTPNTLFDKHGHISTISSRSPRLSGIGGKTTGYPLAAFCFQRSALRSVNHHIQLDKFHGGMAS